MSVEIAGKLSGADLMRAIISDIKSTELTKPPVRVKVWGRTGVNAPYNVIVRGDVVADFLQNVTGLKSQEVHKTQIHIVAESPWRIPEEEKANIMPNDGERRRSYIHSEYAWFNADDTTGEHFLVVAAYRVWEGFKIDRQLFLDWKKRKRKTDKGWEALDKKTKHVEASSQRRAELDRVNTQEGMESFLAETFSSVGKSLLIQNIVHEVKHSERHRKSDGIKFSKRKVKTKEDKAEEELADRTAEEHETAGKYNHMLDFRVNPRKSRRKI